MFYASMMKFNMTQYNQHSAVREPIALNKQTHVLCPLPNSQKLLRYEQVLSLYYRSQFADLRQWFAANIYNPDLSEIPDLAVSVTRSRTLISPGLRSISLYPYAVIYNATRPSAGQYCIVTVYWPQ